MKAFKAYYVSHEGEIVPERRQHPEIVRDHDAAMRAVMEFVNEEIASLRTQIVKLQLIIMEQQKLLEVSDMRAGTK